MSFLTQVLETKLESSARVMFASSTAVIYPINEEVDGIGIFEEVKMILREIIGPKDQTIV